MLLGRHFDDREAGAELSAERRRVVPPDLQTAARFGTIEGEGRHDDRAARFERTTQTLDVCCPIGRIREEVKDGTVVPHINRVDVPRRRHVGVYPPHTCLCITEPCSGAGKGGRRDIQNRHALRAAFEQSIHEAGIPASDIDDSRRGRKSGGVDQAKGECGFGLIPADFG